MEITLTPSQRSLVEDNHNLIYMCLHKYHIHDFDEYYGAAAIGLCKAAATFKPDLGWNFSTYATNVILNELKHEIKSLNKGDSADTLSLDYEIYNQDGDITTLGELLPDKRDIIGSTNSKVDLENKLSKLNNQELEVLKYRLYGYRLNVISDKIGVSRQRVTAINKRLLKILEGTNKYHSKSRDRDGDKTLELLADIQYIIGSFG